MEHLTDRQQAAGLFYTLVSLFLLPTILISLFPKLEAAKLNFVYYVLNFLCTGWILHPYLRQQLSRARENLRSVLRVTAMGFAAHFLCSFLVFIGISLVFPDFSNQNDSNIAQQLSGDFWLVAVGTVLLVPFSEELMHRTVIFGALYRKSPATAYIVSTLFFGAVHVVGYIGTAPAIYLAVSFLQYIPAGLILAWCYRKSGCIFVPMVLHAAINTIGILASR